MNDNLIRLPVLTSQDDPRETQLLAPQLLSFTGNDTLGIWHFSDGMAVIRIGSATETGAETIALERGQIGIAWRALKAIAEAGEKA